MPVRVIRLVKDYCVVPVRVIRLVKDYCVLASLDADYCYGYIGEMMIAPYYHVAMYALFCVWSGVQYAFHGAGEAIILWTGCGIVDWIG